MRQSGEAARPVWQGRSRGMPWRGHVCLGWPPRALWQPLCHAKVKNLEASKMSVNRQSLPSQVWCRHWQCCYWTSSKTITWGQLPSGWTLVLCPWLAPPPPSTTTMTNQCRRLRIGVSSPLKSPCISSIFNELNTGASLINGDASFMKGVLHTEPGSILLIKH